jgi:hypothetical protein
MQGIKAHEFSVPFLLRRLAQYSRLNKLLDAFVGISECQAGEFRNTFRGAVYHIMIAILGMAVNVRVGLRSTSRH